MDKHTWNSEQLFTAVPGELLGVKCLAQGKLSHVLPVLRIEPLGYQSDHYAMTTITYSFKHRCIDVIDAKLCLKEDMHVYHRTLTEFTTPSVLMGYLEQRGTHWSHGLCIDLFGCISTNQIAVVRRSIAKKAGSITCCY